MSQQPGGGSGQGPGPQFIRRAIKLPYTDLALTDRSDAPAELAREWALSLVLPFGIGPNEPRLIAVDDLGRQIVTGDINAGEFTTLIDDPVQSVLKARVVVAADGRANDVGLRVSTMAGLFNGATWDRARAASGPALASQLGLGAAMVSQVGQWSVVSNPAAGAQATATKAAAGAGVRHICSGILISFGAIAAPAATALTWALRDGASGGGTILAQGQVAVPAVPFQSVLQYLGPLAIPGTAATAMTLEFSAALANLLEGVTLLGFDAS